MDWWVRIAAGCALLALVLGTSAHAQQDGGSDFYRGKTITIIIPIGPGGAYDAYARLVSRHLGKHLPGNPLIIARNMPGGGGVIASNHLYNVAPQDGTTLAIITSSFVNEQIFGNPQIKYDARKFLAIGRLLDTTSVLFFWHESHIKTVDDMLRKPSTIGDIVGERSAGLSPACDDKAPRRAVQDHSRLPVGARLRHGRRTPRDRWRDLEPSSGFRNCSRVI